MTLTPRYKAGLFALALLILVDLAVWALVAHRGGVGGSEAEAGLGPEFDDAPVDDGSEGPLSEDGQGGGTLAGTLSGTASEGSRPTGVSLERARTRLEAALGRRQADWAAIARGLRERADVLDEPLLDALMERLIESPQSPRIAEAFAHARHPLVAKRLIDLSTERGALRPVGNAALTALAALPSLDRPTVTRAIGEQLEGEGPASRRWLRALVKVGGRDGLREVVAYLERIDQPDRIPATVWREMGAHERDALGRPLASYLGESRRAEETIALARIAGELALPEVVPALRALDTEGASPLLRSTALNALGTIGTPEAVDHLVRASLGSDNDTTRARNALARMSGREASADTRARLREVLDAQSGLSNGAPKVRAIVVRVLAGSRDPDALPRIAEAVTDPDERVRQASLTALGMYGPKARGQAHTLIDAWGAANDQSKRAIAQSLGSIGGGEAIRALQLWRGELQSGSTLRSVIDHSLVRARAGVR